MQVCIQDLKSRGRVDAIYHADKNIRDMIADEKETTSADHIFSAVRVSFFFSTDFGATS